MRESIIEEILSSAEYTVPYQPVILQWLLAVIVPRLLLFLQLCSENGGVITRKVPPGESRECGMSFLRHIRSLAVTKSGLGVMTLPGM